MIRMIATCLAFLISGTAFPYPQDCGLESFEELIAAAPIIALGEIVEVENRGHAVVLHFTVRELLKGKLEPQVTIDLGIPLLTLAPCTGPGAEKGTALVFLRKAEVGYAAVPGDGGAVLDRRTEFTELLQTVRTTVSETHRE